MANFEKRDKVCTPCTTSNPTTSAVVLPAQPGRIRWAIKAASGNAAPVYFTFEAPGATSAATAANGYPLAAGSEYKEGEGAGGIWEGQISAIATTTDKVTVWSY